MKLETGNFTVKVSVDREAIGSWTPQDILQEITDAVEPTVSQMEGVANIECKSDERALATAPPKRARRSA